ncbi:uncharacterized protein EMH_0100560 [Eimeria mitis]|uniref:N-acetyltransferase domain-containing protein n=1 Tax=Eimeria mitis TaxID=44415 RepID=U6KGH9_9EIME|nr:uncharacterized protein EMH_0100560 [Eimeria mitis]CDJ35871.1 hypothetical protein, conserved [Eimeria mitis]
MAPSHRTERHYCGRFWRIAWLVVLLILVRDGNASDTEHAEGGVDPIGVEQTSPAVEATEHPSEPSAAEERDLKDDGNLSKKSEGTERQDEQVGDNEVKPQGEVKEISGQRDPVVELSHPTYSAVTGTQFMSMVEDAGGLSVGIPPERIVEEIKYIEELNSNGDKSAWPILVFENQRVVCSCLAVHDLEKGSLTYQRFWMHPETIDRARALEALLKEMLNPQATSRMEYLNVVTSPKDHLLTYVLANVGFSLKKYSRDSSGDGMGKYLWAMDLPYLGTYEEHRNTQLQQMAGRVYVMAYSLGEGREWLDYLSITEAEVFERVDVKEVSELASQEQYRAAKFVREKAKLDPQRAGIVNVQNAGSFSLAAVGNSSKTVFGVLKGHISDENICTIDFLGGAGLHEDYIRALLLTEALSRVDDKGLKEIVLKAVPIDDAGFVGLASELGFVVTASSKDSFMMVRDASLVLPVANYVTLPRLYRAQYQALKDVYSGARVPIDGKYLDIAELAGQLVNEVPGLIAKKTQEMYLHIGVALLAVGLVMLAHAVQRARKREAQRRRVRYAHIPDDILVEGEPASGVAVAAEDGNEVQLEAASRPM